MHVNVNVSVSKDVGFVMQMLYVRVMCASCVSSSSCVLHERLLMLVGDAIGDHMDEAYSRVGLMTAL